MTAALLLAVGVPPVAPARIVPPAHGILHSTQSSRQPWILGHTCALFVAETELGAEAAIQRWTLSSPPHVFRQRPQYIKDPLTWRPSTVPATLSFSYWPLLVLGVLVLLNLFRAWRLRRLRAAGSLATRPVPIRRLYDKRQARRSRLRPISRTIPEPESDPLSLFVAGAPPVSSQSTTRRRLQPHRSQHQHQLSPGLPSGQVQARPP